MLQAHFTSLVMCSLACCGLVWSNGHKVWGLMLTAYEWARRAGGLAQRAGGALEQCAWASACVQY